MKWAILFSFISLVANASIFGIDDRIDTQKTDAITQELARSVPALIHQSRIKQVSNHFKLSGIPLRSIDFCADEVFSQESIVATCSASLIAPDKVLTAGHCFNEDYQCSDYKVVFDYQYNGEQNYWFTENQVYQCKKLVFYQYDQMNFSVDLAIIELDRPVLDRNPIKLATQLNLSDSLFMIGYPLGISQKVVESGRVLSIDKKNVSFKTDLDSFSVNSGGPIFNQNQEQVGVLVRGTGMNYQRYGNESCYRWHQEKKDGFSEANDLSPLPSFFLNQH